MLNDIEYTFLSGRFVASNEKLLTQCSNFYSNHYGIWSNKGIHPQKRIKLSNSMCKIFVGKAKKRKGRYSPSQPSV